MAYLPGKVMELNQLKEQGFNPKNILDIGAHRGQFYGWAKTVWPESSITMIEANLCHEDILKSIVDKSPIDSYLIATLGDSKRTVNFFTRSDKPWTEGASYYKELNFWDIPQLVLSLPRELQLLDELFADDTFELIKIDTQGSELDIMSGGLHVCKRANYIILEISLIPYNEGAPSTEMYFEFMKNLNFEEFCCVGEHVQDNKIIQRDIVFINREL
jgi:FkbM family methyltransferase